MKARLLIAAALLLAAAACRAPLGGLGAAGFARLPAATVRPAGGLQADPQGRVAPHPDMDPHLLPAVVLTGSVRITIRWPARTNQAIPQSATRLEVAAFREGATTPWKTLTADRPPGDQSSTTSLTFDRMPVGTYQFTAAARDAQNRIVASGNAPGVLLPNQLVRVNLHLFTTDAPAITGLGAAAAVPGQRVAIFGRAFGENAGSPVTVAIGGTTLPGQNVERITDGMLVVTVPPGVASGKVKVMTGGLEAESAEILGIIARLEASPSIAHTHQPAGRVRFSLKAFDAQGGELPATAVDWRILSMECEDPGESCLDVAVPGPEAGMFDASDDEVGEQVGTATIRIGSDLLYTTVKVVTHELSPADLPDGMGPLGPVPYPEDNEPTQARAELGKKLFFDAGLSGSGQMSCATCHDPAKGFADGRAKGLANDGGDLPRHTPTALNAAYMPVLFWDGRAASLEDQAMAVFVSPREFNSNLTALVAYVKGKYGAEFQTAYGAEPTAALVTKAIASYERKILVTGDSAFDRWARGDDAALSDEEKIGLGMFLGKSGCVACHNGALFSDGKFHNIGIPGSGTVDAGRAGITKQPGDVGAFKTPTLRNVALTAPYFHDGSRATLADAIRFYENFDAGFPNLDKDMTRSNFSTELLAFLNALTSPPVAP